MGLVKNELNFPLFAVQLFSAVAAVFFMLARPLRVPPVASRGSDPQERNQSSGALRHLQRCFLNAQRCTKGIKHQSDWAKWRSHFTFVTWELICLFSRWTRPWNSFCLLIASWLCVMLKSMEETRWHSFPTPNNEAAGGCDSEHSSTEQELNKIRGMIGSVRGDFLQRKGRAAFQDL